MEREYIENSEESEQKIFEIKKYGSESKMKIFLAMELFRLVFLFWFLSVIAVGAAVTIGFVETDYKKTIKSLVGSVNVCVYFDFPPSTYILPSMYALLPVITFLYCIASIFRAWISMEENKISLGAFISYSVTFIYFFLSSACFATIFAVQPDAENLQETWKIHALPFTNLIFAMMLQQIAFAWFYGKVASSGFDAPNWYRISIFTVTFTLALTTIIKMIQHINSMGGLQLGENQEIIDNGWIVSVNNEILGIIGQINDAIYMLSAIVVPFFQSGYLTWRKFDTHGLIVTIEDNRLANEVCEPLLSASDK